MKILITGSEGLIGRHLRARLQRAGHITIGLDNASLKITEKGDVRNVSRLHNAIKGCGGVIHLAAVSRVIWGQRDPELCYETNVQGTANVLEAARQAQMSPWLIYASSREVYGEPESLPVVESAQIMPVNIYGESKADAERLVQNAGKAYMPTAIVRLSNVYGCIHDHADRVVPAFARAAAFGEKMRVDGKYNTFDFTHVKDTVEGIYTLVNKMTEGHSLPPIHFLTGSPTSLVELAQLARNLSGNDSIIEDAPSRSYDVSRFYGDPQRAMEILGWRAEVTLRDGLGRLIHDFKRNALEVA